MSFSVYKILYGTWFNFFPKMLGITVLLQSNEIWYLLVNHGTLHIEVSENPPWRACLAFHQHWLQVCQKLDGSTNPPQMVVLFGTLNGTFGRWNLAGGSAPLEWPLPAFISFFLSATLIPGSLRHLRPYFPSLDGLHPARIVSQKKRCLQ